MKKILLVAVAVSMMTSADAQKKNIQSASNSLKYKEYKEAVDFIELAVKDPSTQSDPKAWFTRGVVYLTMDQDPGYADKGYYKDVVSSYKKVIELKPNYEQEAVNSGLMYGAYKSYNNAVGAYNAKKYDEAYELAKMTVDIHDMEGGKRFAGNKGFDTVASGALVIQAYSAFYNEQPDKALPVLEALKDNPIEGNNANTFLIITDVYRKKGDQAKELATLEEAKKRFPNNTNLRNEELNYYIRTKQQDKLIQKLEDAVKSEPENPVYQYNLANAYTNMAFPKTDGKADAQPSNYKELIAKAEAGFTKATALDPDNVGYEYDFGVLYFNQASQVTEEMNKYTGISAEEEKKWTELQKVREELFAKAFPHLEKVYIAYEPKVKQLDADNKFMYQSALSAMREIYARQNKLDKASELKKKIDESNQ